jgi:hypothetical protein
MDFSSPASDNDSTQCMPLSQKAPMNRTESTFKATDVVTKRSAKKKQPQVKQQQVFKPPRQVVLNPPRTGMLEQSRNTTQRIVNKGVVKGLYDPKQMDILHVFLEEVERICNLVRQAAPIVTRLKKNASKNKKAKKCSSF